MINWIVSASVLIVVVLLIRLCFHGKISARLQYALWGLVLLRLLLPVPLFSSPLSVSNVLPQEPQIAQTVPQVPAAPPEIVPAHPPQSETALQPSDVTTVCQEGVTVPAPTVIHWDVLLKATWLTGMGLVGLVFLSSNLLFWWKLRQNRTALTVADCPLPVYVTDAVETPCLFGLLFSAVYVTKDAASDALLLRHTVSHELTHHRHGDHLWAILRGLCLAVHWFNPLVWYAAMVSRKDAELACDESTIRRLGEPERAAYGKSLLRLTCQRPTNPLCAATTMTGSKSELQERIVRIVKHPKTTLAALTAVVLIGLLTAGCTFTGKEADIELPPEASVTEQEAPTPEAPAPAAPEAPDTSDLHVLTKDEIRQVNEAFVPDYVDEQGNLQGNPINPFFTSYYDDVRDLNLLEFLRYFPAPSRKDLTDDDRVEFQALQQSAAFQNSWNQTYKQVMDLPVPVHRLPRGDVDAVLQQYAGITTEDLHGVGTEFLPYLESYDAYYTFTSDYGPGLFDCIYGELEGDTLRLYSSSYYSTPIALLTMEQVDGRWLIRSHQAVNRESVPALAWGIQLTAEDVTPTGMTLVCTQHGGNARGQLETSPRFLLEARSPDGWQYLSYQIDSPVFEDLLLTIDKDSTVRWNLDWEALYGELPAGTYRLSKEITDFVSENDKMTDYYFVEFTIS